jgi:DNA modification methylase
MTRHPGDCLAILPTLEAESIDAIVTDPPYGLGFMGKAWDHGVPGIPFWREMLRVAKPGAHLLAFGGARTVHRIASAIEDAGWEIRDTLVWAYASGFPKSLDVSKAIDKAAGAEREVVAMRGHAPSPGALFAPGEYEGLNTLPRTAPATDAAREWQGWGTALKPAWEPIVMARKPLRGTVAGNVQAYGTGALNIDGTRIAGVPPSVPQPDLRSVNGRATRLDANARNGEMSEASGRWPANVILTDPIFDGDTPGVVGGGWQSGDGNPANRYAQNGNGVTMGDGWATGPTGAEPVDTDGTYSRFFLIPKAPRHDREPVIVSPLRADSSRHNVHPTVKPTDLMRHLVRLVTPPGGIVLDPFLGSGTTALAAEMEGFGWVGIEREAEYVAIAEARLNGTQKGLGL